MMSTGQGGAVGEGISRIAGERPDDGVGAALPATGLGAIGEPPPADAHLREAEARWRFALEGSGDGVWDWDVATGKVFFSHRWKKMLGYEDGEVGDDLSEWEGRVHPDDKAGTLAAVQAHLDGRTPAYVSEHRVRCKDGTYKWILDRGLVVSRGADGSPLRAIGTHSDISARKAVETALRESGQLISEIIASAQEGIIVYGPDLRYQVWSPFMEMYTGMTAAQVLGRHPLEVFPFLKDGGVMQRLEQALSGEIPDAAEFPFVVASSGKSGWASDLSGPLRNAEGEIVGVIGTVRDITDFKRAETALREMNESLERRVEERTRELAAAKLEAEAANRAKSAFLANMSHEIRTPMTAIVGMGELMRLEALSPTQAERLEKINLSARHLLAIIDDVLDLSKIEAGKVVLEAAELALAEIVAEVAAISGERARARGLEIRVDCVAVPGALVGDATRIRQALLNYLANAIKFSENGFIELRVRMVEDRGHSVRLRFEVHDQGIGIDPEAAGRLFRHFEQADNSMTRKHGGTGLGLAIVREIAELMGGEVGVESRPGAGSSFWFTAVLQRARGTERASSPVSAPEAEEGGNVAGRRVLVVDDEAMNREVIHAMLETLDLVIDLAANGREAVEKVATGAYDLILMDLHMPLMDGLEATRQIRSKGLVMPIVALTGDAISDVAERCRAAGMVGFIPKPFGMDEMLGEVCRWLRASGGGDATGGGAHAA